MEGLAESRAKMRVELHEAHCQVCLHVWSTPFRPEQHQALVHVLLVPADERLTPHASRAAHTCDSLDAYCFPRRQPNTRDVVDVVDVFNRKSNIPCQVQRMTVERASLRRQGAESANLLNTTEALLREVSG